MAQTKPEGFEAWPPEAKEAWEAAARELAGEEALVADLTEQRAAAAASPEAVLLAQRAALAEARRAREAAAQALEDDEAQRKAEAQHGARIRVIYTEAGRLILRAQTELEWDQVQARVASLAKAALEAGDEARAEADSVAAYREGLFKQMIHPTKEKAKAILAQFPGAWIDCYNARDELLRGTRTAAGKGAAR